LTTALNAQWLLEQLTARVNLSDCPITVAFSGGVDSTVLLHLLVQLRNQGCVATVRAVHVHHGISRYAEQWVEHCQSVCDRWQVPLTIARVVPDNNGFGLEQAAREARYRVFVAAMHDGGCLLQGHHRDDQAETVLLRLFRGTGIDGVRGIPEQRSLGNGQLLRPLLSQSRAAIDAYANACNLSFVEDDSNHDERFSRNFLRQRLIPMVEARWPGASARLVAFAREAGEFQAQLEMDAHLASCVVCRPRWLLGQQALIDCRALQQLDDHCQRLVLRRWLNQQSIGSPSRTTLERIFQEVVAARPDAEPQLTICRHHILTRFRQTLVVLDDRSNLPAFAPMAWDWQREPRLQLGDRSLLCAPLDGTQGPAVRLPATCLTLKRRCHIAADNKFAIAGRQGRKPLKKWLQEYNVPPWLRESLPFVFDQEQMIAAPGLWVCEGYQSQSEDGLSIRWQCGAVSA